MKPKSYLIPLFLLIILSCSSDTTIETSGTMEGKDVTVSSQVSGIVKKILKNEGDEVKTGDIILQIDSSEYILQLKQSEALLIQAKAQYDLAKKGARNEDIVSAKEASETARANYESAKKDFDRFVELFKSNSITSKQYDDAKTRLSVTEGQYKQTQENYKKVQNGSRPEELELAKGRYDQIAAQTELTRKKVRDCSIKATSNGTITKISVDEGELVNPGAQVAKLTDLNEVTMKIFVKETDLGNVKLGQHVGIVVDSFPDSTINGSITFISNSAEFTPKNIQSKDDRVKLVFQVKLTIPNPEQKLKAGMIGDVKI